jgi:hypothetical protein
MGSGCLHRSNFGLPGWLSLFLEGRSMAVAHAGYPVYLWLAGPSFSSRSITGADYLAINMPIVTMLIIKGLSYFPYTILIDSGSFRPRNIPKNVDAQSWNSSGGPT